jgi:hypothetical protein
MKLIRYFAGAALVAACSTPTTLSDVWRDPSYAASPMKKILVFGAVNSDTNRRTLEDTFASSLARHNVQATAAYHAFPGQPDRNAAREYLRAEGFDGALVVKYEGTHTQTTIQPGADFGNYYDGLWGPGYYVETDQLVKVETSLWDAHSGKVVWSAVSDTENPTSSADAITSLVTKLTASLTDARLIPPAMSVSYATGRTYAY